MAVIQHDALECTCYVRPAGQVESMRCGLCGTECNVERNRPPIRHWATGGTGMHVDHDLFQCPNTEANWHEKAFSLLEEMAATASKRVRAMLHADLVDVLAEQGIEFRPNLPGLVADGADRDDDGSSRRPRSQSTA